MAQYEHLPLFKDAYDFNLYFFKLSRGFPKDFKYGLGQEIKEQISALLDHIIAANDSIDKRECLKQAESCIKAIRVKVRMLKDMEIISLKSYNYIFTLLIKISKQVIAWKGWSESAH